MYRLTISSYLSLMCYGLCVTIIGPALGPVRDTFSLSAGELGLFTTGLSIGLIIGVLLSGYVVDRYSIKAMGIAGQLIIAAGFLLFGLGPDFITGLFSFFLMGIAGGIIETVTNTVISELYRDRRASALNLLHAFFGIGAVVGPILSGGLIDSGMGWRAVYLIVAVFSAGVVIPLFMSKFPARTSSEGIDFSAVFRIAKTPYALFLGAMIILYVGSEMGINYWSVLYLTGSRHLSMVVASSFLAYFWVAVTVGRLGVSWAAQRIGERRLLAMLAAGSLISYGVFIAAGVGWVLGVTLALVGLFFSGIFPTIIGLGVNRFPHTPGTVNGFLLTFMGSGVLIFPYLVGQIAERFSLFAGMIGLLFVMALLFALTGVLALARKRG